jgi:hypothetical protein
LKPRQDVAQKGDLLSRPIEQCQVQIRCANRQGYTWHPGTGAEVEHSGTTWQQLTLQEIERLRNQHINDAFCLAQTGEVDMTTPLQ